MKHTPKPWFPTDIDGVYCVSTEPHNVLFEHVSGYDREERVANVTLAAAAPELLESLEYLLELTRNTPEAITSRGFSTTNGDLLREQARAASAIAKATGGEA